VAGSGGALVGIATGSDLTPSHSFMREIQSLYEHQAIIFSSNSDFFDDERRFASLFSVFVD
jgi:hypothetical protein